MEASAIAARSKLEAVVRISGLTHRQPEALGPGSTERKSVLLNLAADLDLHVDGWRPKPEVGAQIASALGTHWDSACWSSGSTITLTGLNRILLAAQKHILERTRARQLELFEARPSAGVGFVPARSKFEAVTRISALTGAPPETLGPGSKERKSVLTNLATGLGLPVYEAASKPEMGREIVERLGAGWDKSCWSAGHTITLEGLNRLLRSAEWHLAQRGTATVGLFFSARDEARGLLEALAQVLPDRWQGRACVEEMWTAEYSQWAQDEWAAFYFEFVGLPALINAFGGGPRKFANTRIDYSLGHPWDLKVHMADSPMALLNDQVAVQEGLKSGAGLGFVVLTGEVVYDDGDFRAWQKAFRAQHGKVAKVRSTPPAYVRKSKVSFRPALLEAFFIEDVAALDAAIETGAIQVMRQGKQTSGAARPPKYALHLGNARWAGSLLLAQSPL